MRSAKRGSRRANISRAHEAQDPNYRICVVTGARLIIFQYQPKKGDWINECTGREVRSEIKTLETAIVSLQ